MTLPFVLVPMCLGTHSRISILSSTLTKRDFRFPPAVVVLGAQQRAELRMIAGGFTLEG